MMKLGAVIIYLKKIQKIYKSRDTSHESCWHQQFFTENQQILLYQVIHVQIAFWYKIFNYSSFSWVFKDCFNKKKVISLIMSAKMASQGLLKIVVFWDKGYDVIIYDHDVTNKILSLDSNYIVDLVMWPNFGNSSISMREVIIISILEGFD